MRTPHIDPTMAERLTFWRQRPEGVASSLEVVEAFFGHALDERIVEASRHLTHAQVNELSGGVASEAFKQHASLKAKPLVPVPKSAHPPLRKIKDEGLRELIEASEVSPYPLHDYIMDAGDIFVHEAVSLNTGHPIDIANAEVLKHLALYCRHVLVRDPLPVGMWKLGPEGDIIGVTSTDERRRQLADGLRQLLPVAELVRSGAFMLYAENPMIAPFANFEFTDRKGLDPFLSWIVERERPGLLAELRRASREESSQKQMPAGERGRVATLVAQASTVIERHYPYPLAAGELQIIRQMAQYAHQMPLSPVTSSPAIARHLVQSARVALDGHPDLSEGAIQAVPALGLAVKYQIPSLSDVSFGDIAKLRAKEDIFKQIRTVLARLATSCAADGSFVDYAAYKAAVSEHAREIVGPTYKLLDSWRRSAGRRKLGIAAASKTAAFGLDAITGRLPLGNIVEEGLDRTIGRITKRQYADADLACRILGSVVLY